MRDQIWRLHFIRHSADSESTNPEKACDYFVHQYLNTRIAATADKWALLVYSLNRAFVTTKLNNV